MSKVKHVKYGLFMALAGSLVGPAWAYQSAQSSNWSQYQDQVYEEEILDLGFQDDAASYGEVRLLPARTAEQVRVQERRVAPSQPRVVVSQRVAPPVIQQPLTYVEATPLEDSKAARLRKAREGAEVQTEQRIVEKLEESRLQDEKRRAERLFGNRLDESEGSSQIQSEPVQTPVQTPVQHQVVVVKEDVVAKEEKPDDLDRQVRSAERSFMETARLETQLKQPEVREQSYYISAALGLAEYAEASNIYGELATGFSLGTEMPNGVVVEGNFLYSNFIVDEFWRHSPVFREMDQYNVGLAVKYNLLKGSLKPNVGAVASYTHRSYGDRQRQYGYQHRQRGYPNDGKATSNAFDLGLSAGLDLRVTENFSVGTEFRYMMNVINKSESEFLQRSSYWAPRYSSPIEEFSYYSWTLNGKVHF